jgi:hypothetical protein
VRFGVQVPCSGEKSAATPGNRPQKTSIQSIDARVAHLAVFGHGYAPCGVKIILVAFSVGAVIDIPFEHADAVHNAERCESIRRDISHRLRSICADLTATDFLLLVNSMVAMQMKGELRKNRFFGAQ